MKKIFVVITGLLSISAFSQNGIRILYELNFKPNIQKDSLLKDYYNLDIFLEDNKSDFYNYSYNKNDSIVNKLMKNSMSINLEHLPKPKLPLAAKYVNSKLSYFETLDGDSFQFSDRIPVWEISNETKTVKDWNCKKATTNFNGRKWTAWFCPELSFSEGPYKFKGLLGLIVEAYDDGNNYHFSAEALTKIESVNLFPKIYANPILTSKGKYKKLLLNYKKDPAGKLRQGILVDESGVKMHFTSGLDKNLIDKVTKERLKKINDFNNPLELEN